MEEGIKSKKTVFIGGVGEELDESAIYEHFATFGDIMEVQLPSATTNPNYQQSEPAKHRGFAFVTYGSSADAQDAIDNMDMNEMRGHVLKVSLAKPMKTPMQLGGNRAVWESEEWLKEYVKPLAESGGVQGRRPEADEPEDTMEE